METTLTELLGQYGRHAYQPLTEASQPKCEIDRLGQFVTTHDSEVELCHLATTHGDSVEGRWKEVWVKSPEKMISRLDGIWRRPRHIERLWVIMDLILERIAAGDQQKGFCPISTKSLSKMIGRDFACISLKKLVEIGFIECDGKYFSGKKAKGYRFTPETAAIEAVPRQLSAALTRRIARWRSRRSTISIEHNPQRKTLWEHLQRLTLHPLARRKIPPAGKQSKFQLKQDAWRRSANAVDCRRWYFTHDPKSGRVFNNVTSLPKSMRGYLLLDGQACSEIDIRNSQPLFMAGLYPEKSEEARHYEEIVTSGRFYEAINQAGGLSIGQDDRERLKKAIYSQVLFGRCYLSSKLWKGFQQLFPILAEIIAVSKSKDYRLLPIELQRLEASAMIGKVVPRLTTELPNIPFLTVHDSLLVPHQYASRCEEILKQVIEDTTGLTPNLRITKPPLELLSLDDECSAKAPATILHYPS